MVTGRELVLAVAISLRMESSCLCCMAWKIVWFRLTTGIFYKNVFCLRGGFNPTPLTPWRLDLDAFDVKPSAPSAPHSLSGPHTFGHLRLLMIVIISIMVTIECNATFEMWLLKHGYIVITVLHNIPSTGRGCIHKLAVRRLAYPWVFP